MDATKRWLTIVLFARPHADAPAAAAALAAVLGDRRALDVAGSGDGDRDVLVGNQVLDPELAFGVDDCGAALVAELLAHRLQLVDDDLHQQDVAREDAAQLLDERHQLGELVEDLLALEAGQPLQLHLEDGLRLRSATRPNVDISPSRASAVVFDARISAITWSR